MATISFSTTFNLVPALPVFYFTDTSNYVGQGIATSDVNGCFRIISPSGATIYNNNDFSDGGCDIKVSTSVANKITIYLPVDSNVLVEEGNYTIIYTVYDKNLLQYYTKTSSFDNEYVKPVIEITQDVNVIAQLFSQTDVTNYVVNGAAPTISRVNKLTYPAGVKGGPPAPVTTNAATLRTTVFFNGTQTSTVTTTATYTFADGLQLVDSLFGSKEILVDGTYYCSIACKLKNYAKKIDECDLASKNIYQNNYTLAAAYMNTIMVLVECNGGSDISWILQKVEDLLGDCNCGCDDDDDDQFTRVTGWGSLVGTDGTNGTNGVDGTNGTNGTNGADGVAVLYNDFSGTAKTGTFKTLNSYSLPANTLTANGDIVQVNGSILGSASDIAHLKMEMGGVDAMPSIATNGYLYIDFAVTYSTFEAKITRLSATTVNIAYSFITNFPVPWGSARTTQFYEATITVNNLTTDANLIDLQGSTAAANTITCEQMVVTYFKKQ